MRNISDALERAAAEAGEVIGTAGYRMLAVIVVEVKPGPPNIRFLVPSDMPMDAVGQLLEELLKDHIRRTEGPR